MNSKLLVNLSRVFTAYSPDPDQWPVHGYTAIPVTDEGIGHISQLLRTEPCTIHVELDPTYTVRHFLIIKNVHPTHRIGLIPRILPGHHAYFVASSERWSTLKALFTLREDLFTPRLMFSDESPESMACAFMCRASGEFIVIIWQHRPIFPDLFPAPDTERK